MRRVVLLVLFGLALGAGLTGAAGALPGSQGLNPLSWLATVATVAALVVAVGIFRVQQSQSDAAHQELLDALKAQDEILQDLAESTPPDSEREADVPAEEDDGLTDAQREAVRAKYGDRAIEAAWSPDRGRGRARVDAADAESRARLVRLDDGTLVAVYPRGGRMHVHQVKPRGGRPRPQRDSRAQRPRSG